MTAANEQSCNKLDSFRIMAIKELFKVGLMNCKKNIFKSEDYFHSADWDPACSVQ